MGAERHPAFVDLAQFGQRHHLETAGIGEDRQRPVHKLMEAAKRRDGLSAGAQHQMIGIAEDDLGTGRTDVVRHQAFHSRLRPDRHESRRLHLSTRRDEFAAACVAVSIEQLEGEGFAHRPAG